MVKLIIGGTGSGKTKELIDQVNAAVKEEKGSVVCISRGNKLTFDISHDARLIDAADYPVSDSRKPARLCRRSACRQLRYHPCLHRRSVQDHRRQGRSQG